MNGLHLGIGQIYNNLWNDNIGKREKRRTMGKKRRVGKKGRMGKRRRSGVVLPIIC